MEGQYYSVVEPDYMSAGHLELLLVVAALVVLVWFVWVHIASDLPDDFISILRKSRKGDDDGRLRDHG